VASRKRFASSPPCSISTGPSVVSSPANSKIIKNDFASDSPFLRKRETRFIRAPALKQRPIRLRQPFQRRQIEIPPPLPGRRGTEHMAVTHIDFERNRMYNSSVRLRTETGMQMRLSISLKALIRNSALRASNQPSVHCQRDRMKPCEGFFVYVCMDKYLHRKFHTARDSSRALDALGRIS